MRTELEMGNATSWKSSARTGLTPLALLAGFALLSACGPGGMQPVDETKPSEDPLILNASPTMSDGSPVPEHRTETVQTSIEMMSDGLIGGMSVDAHGNIYNTNFRESVWRTAPSGETIQLNGEFTSASGNFVLENGDLLQGEWTDNRIYRIKPDGTRFDLRRGRIGRAGGHCPTAGRGLHRRQLTRRVSGSAPARGWRGGSGAPP